MARYSYNGTVLPQLPEWDKEKYPYAIIFGNAGSVSNRYELLCISAPFSAPSGDDLKFSASVDGYEYTCLDTDGSWTDHGEAVWDTGGITGDNVFLAIIVSTNPFVWTNTDILDDAGNVVYAASTPVIVFCATSYQIGIAAGMGLEGIVR